MAPVADGSRHERPGRPGQPATIGSAERARGWPGWRASSCGRRAGSRKATVTSSSSRVSFERDHDPVAPARVADPVAVAVAALAGDDRPRRRTRRRAAGARGRRTGARRAVASASSSQALTRPAPSDARRRPAGVRLALRGRGRASAGTPRPARRRARAGRSPAGTRRRPRRIGVPNRDRPPRAEHEVEVERRPSASVVARAAAGPTISSAGISSRKRDGTRSRRTPQVARRQACDRYSRRFARVMPDVREPALLLQLAARRRAPGCAGRRPPRGRR